MENGIAILCFLIFVMFDVHSFYFENCLTSTVKSMLLVIYSALPTLKYTGLLSILSQVFILMVLVALWPAGTAEGFVTFVEGNCRPKSNSKGYFPLFVTVILI